MIQPARLFRREKTLVFVLIFSGIYRDLEFILTIYKDLLNKKFGAGIPLGLLPAHHSN